MVKIVVPVKKLKLSKSRLAPFLNEEERISLTISMLNDVLLACNKVVKDITVIGSDEEVKSVAENYGAKFVNDKWRELNEALNSYSELAEMNGEKEILIIPCDVPSIKAEDILKIKEISYSFNVVISPSKDFKGTNALFKRPPKAIPCRFGKNSFKKHVEESIKSKLNFAVYRSAGLSLDIDRVEDLASLAIKEDDSFTLCYLKKSSILSKIIKYSKRDLSE